MNPKSAEHKAAAICLLILSSPSTHGARHGSSKADFIAFGKSEATRAKLDQSRLEQLESTLKSRGHGPGKRFPSPRCVNRRRLPPGRDGCCLPAPGGQAAMAQRTALN